MAFSVGDRLGRFEILGSLGAGGMGEVYRARDHQLSRDVAIKVLPAAFSDDADRRRRFEQEARAAGGLNHPNILAVYDIGIERGSSYIVTELLEGETLQERMAGRPLPPRKAADYALQIASGLAAAHDRGVVHRDIKPGNLFVTTDGRIKILDFGLAKLIGPDSSLQTETVTVDGSPDGDGDGRPTCLRRSARGLRVDHRTDIFSFGVVLYEMLAGFPPFRRVTAGDTLNAILHDEPAELSATDPEIPALERIVRHCLEKQPDERFQNFRDLLFDLENPAPSGGAVPSRPASTLVGERFSPPPVWSLSQRRWRSASLVSPVLRPAPASPAIHRVLPMTDFVGLEEFPSISPDGNMVAFTAAQSGRRQVFIRFLKGGPARPVTSDDADHQAPRWLPDGSALVYFSPAAPGEVQGAIYRIPTLGGSSQRVIASIGGGDVSRERTAGMLQARRGAHSTGHVRSRRVGYPTGRDSSRRGITAIRDGRPTTSGSRSRRETASVGTSTYVSAGGGTPVNLTNDDRFIEGLTWLPDSSGIVHASSRGSTVPYLPPLALWEVSLDRGRPPRQLTPAEASYEQPDVHESGLVSATRLQDAVRPLEIPDRRRHRQQC